MTLVLNGTTGVSAVDGSASTPAVQGGDTNTGVFFPAADTVAIATNGTERVRTDSSGNVGIGVTPSAWDSGFSILQTGSAGASFGGRSSANTAYVISNAVRNGSAWKYINNNTSAQFQVENGNFYWFTAPSGTAGNAISFTQAMTMDASGNLLVGTTSNLGSGARLNINYAFSNDGAAWQSNTTSEHNAIVFKNSNGTVGRIATSGSSTSYVTSSDYRLKHDIAPMTGALAKVAALKPVTYKWNADDSGGEGFIAHELAEVCPHAVAGEKDAVDAEGNPVYQGIDTSFLVATLTAAIQELKTELDAVKAELASLKGTA